MISRIIDQIYDKYSKTITRLVETSSNIAYFSLKISWYVIPIIAFVIAFSIVVFTLTWILYLLFYIYWIPPKSVIFPLNFEYKNHFLSQLYNKEYTHFKKESNDHSRSSMFGNGNVYNNIQVSSELTAQLLYEQSEATAPVSFNNATWGLENTKTKLHLDAIEPVFVEESESDGRTSKYEVAISYITSLYKYGINKVYNFLTFNWFGKKVKKTKASENVINSHILGNEIDILVELYYYPTKYNSNIVPFQVSIDLIECIESNTNNGNSNTRSPDVFAEFKKTATTEYIPDILVSFREYLSIIPSLMGLKMNGLGFGLESKVVVKIVENFPLLKRHNTQDSLKYHEITKLCGANIKMKPALYVSRANLIFQTKLKFWKEVIRSHPILMGNIISISFTIFCLMFMFMALISSGVYLLWKKNSIRSYSETLISNSFNCTPSSMRCNSIGSNEVGKGLSANLSRENKLFIDYSLLPSSSTMFNGLLPLETKHISTSHSRNQYIINENDQKTPINGCVKFEGSANDCVEAESENLCLSGSSESTNKAPPSCDKAVIGD